MPAFVCLAIALFFAWLFAVSAWHKLRYPQYYRQLLHSWFGVRAGAAGAVALAGIEAGLAVAMLVSGSREAALVLAAVVLTVYAAGMGWQLARGRGDLKCGCSGPASDTRISASLVWRNLLCALLAGLAAQPQVAVGADGATSVVTVLMAGFLCLLYLCGEQLVNNAQRFATENR